MIMDSEEFETDLLGGVLVITDKKTGALHSLSLRDDMGRNITRQQFISCVKSHGLNRACRTLMKISNVVTA